MFNIIDIYISAIPILFFGVLVIFVRNSVHSVISLMAVFCFTTIFLIILGCDFIAFIFLMVYVGAIAVLFLFVVMMLNIKVLELDETFWKYAPVGLFISSLFILQIFYLIFGFSFEELYFFFDSEKFSLLRRLNFTSNSIFLPLNYSYINGVYYTDHTLDTSLLVDFSAVIYSNTFYVFIDYTSSNYLNYLVLADDFTNTELLGWIVYTYTFFIFLVIGLILLLSMIGSIVLVLNQNINVKRQLIFRQTLRNLKSAVILKY